MSSADEDTSTSREETGPVHWCDKATKILLTEYQKKEGATSKGKNPKKKMWMEISDELKKNGFTFTWEQVMGRWKTLVAALKRTNDHNRRSGSDRRTCSYQKELEDIMNPENPTLRPAATTGTSIFKENKEKRKTIENKKDSKNTQSDGSDIEADPATVTKAEASQVKKRKTGNSEMIDFLKTYVAQQDEEKKALREERKAMHDEKMNLFKSLLQEMKK